ncbi:MAG: hypothetical protein WA936_09830 [Erythrobacter sp.]|uniref:hypothetical protein n=1 Tax=Erythrobacter sp. TaxID=1042 RepID=UPI003C727F0C
MLLVLFVLGVANFALHRAVLESGHRLLDELPSGVRKAGKRLTLSLEFAVLLAAMLFAANGSTFAVLVYGGYVGLNAFSAWLMLSGRV